MPEPNRVPYVFNEDLARVTFARLIEQRAVIVLQCHGCWHEGLWRAEDLQRKFPGRHELTFARIAPKLRCSKCRSEWLQVVRMHGALADAAIERQTSRQSAPQRGAAQDKR